jgi:hypothetical protein
MKKLFISAVVIAVLIGVGIYLMYNKPHRSTDTADESIDAETLVTAFDQNENDANKRFLDKVLEVKGRVKEVAKQDNGYVLLLGEEGSIASVSCTLNPEQDAVAFGLKAGDEVVVRGICTGFLLDVVLINCSVVTDGSAQL